MSVFDNYRPEQRPRLKKGLYRVEIIDAEETRSKKDAPMLVITIRPNVANARIKDFMVSTTNWFNATLTEFYECFGIEVGDENMAGWVGATGVVYLDEDGQYMRIKRYVKAGSDEEKSVDPWDGPLPERQTVRTISDAADPNEDDFPSSTSADDDDELPF